MADLSAGLVAHFRLSLDGTDKTGNYTSVVSPGVVFNGILSTYQNNVATTVQTDLPKTMFLGNNAWTVSGWVDLRNTNTFEYAMGNGLSGEYGPFTLRSNGLTQIQFIRATASGTISSLTTANPTGMFHFVVWYSALYIYLQVNNGTAASVYSYRTADSTRGDDFRFGEDTDGVFRSLEGDIANVRIYNEAKDAAFRTALFDEGYLIPPECNASLAIEATAAPRPFYRLDNTASGNYGLVPTTSPFTNHRITLLIDEVIGTQFILPTTHDWLIVETYDVDGIVGAVSYTGWTDDVSGNLVDYLISIQDTVIGDSSITTFKMAATRYVSSTGLVDTYEGDETITIAPVGIGEPKDIPAGEWQIATNRFTPYPPIMELTTIAGTNTHDVQILSLVDQQVVLIDLSDGSTIDTQVGTDVTITIPETGDIRNYKIYAPISTQIKFLGVAKHSAVSFSAVAKSITSLDNLYADGSNVTSFGWVGDCNATTAINAFNNCAIIDFPAINFVSCTNFTTTFAYFSGTFAGIPTTSAGTNFHQCFTFFTGTNIPAIDLSNATVVTEIARSSSAPIDTFNMNGLTNMTSMFYLYSGTINSLDTSTVTNFYFAFRSFSGGTIPALDMTAATYVKWMFYEATSGYTSLNTSSLGVFDYIFDRYAFTGAYGTVDMTAATSIQYMFQNTAAGGSFGSLDLRTVAYNYAFNVCRLSFTAINISGRADINTLFYGYSYTGDLPIIDLSSAQNLYQTFQYTTCSTTNQTLDLTSATVLDNCFDHSTGALGTIIITGSASCEGMFFESWSSIAALTTTGKTTLANIFEYYRYGGYIPAIDASSATDVGRMFYYCDAGYNHPLDTSSATRAYGLFETWYGAGLALSVVPDLDLSSCVGAAAVSNMFSGLTLDLSTVTINTTGVTDFQWMFYNYLGAETPAVLDTSSGSNFSHMFRYSNCNIPTILDLSNATTTYYMFREKTVGSLPATMTIGALATSVENMFSYCTLSSPAITLLGSTTVSMFKDHRGPSATIVSAVNATNWTECFRSATTLVIDVDTSAGQIFNWCFGDGSPVGQTIAHLDLRNATSMENMFYSNKGVIASMDTTGVTNFRNCFNSRKGTELPSFDSSSGTDFYNFCGYNTFLTCIPDLDTTSKVAADASMFQNSNVLVSPDAATQDLLEAAGGYIHSAVCP